MRMRIGTIGAGCAAVALAVSWVAAAEPAFHWKGRVATGKSVEIKGVNGAIAAVAATGGDIEVDATKRGRRSDPAQVEIKVVEHEGGVTICAVYPNAPGESPNECHPGHGGRMNTGNNDVSVSFTVHVPAGVRFVGRTVNGDVEATSMPSDAEIQTVNGRVQVSAAGEVQARTVNGSIEASLGRSDGKEPLLFETVNGSITVNLPASTQAAVRAKTVNGEITTGFPLTVEGTISKRRLTGTIGGGGRELNLSTVNGSIHLRKPS